MPSKPALDSAGMCTDQKASVDARTRKLVAMISILSAIFGFEVSVFSMQFLARMGQISPIVADSCLQQMLEPESEIRILTDETKSGKLLSTTVRAALLKR